MLAGAALAAGAVMVLWMSGLVPTPESISRRLAALVAVYPGPWRQAEVARIPCPVLGRLRLYVVCTEGCDGVWTIVGVRGLRAVPLASPGRTQTEPPEETRRRLNQVVSREGLRLDADGARQMIACYLAIDGLSSGLILDPTDLAALEEARGDDDRMHELADSLEDAGEPSRIPIVETEGGFESRFLYWNIDSAERPVVEIDYLLARDGTVGALRIRERPVRGGTASGNTPDSPPT